MIKGFVKSSYTDYPGKICSTIFIGGCNFRCSYCHNPEIVNNTTTEIPEKKIMDYLDSRKKLIDAVCITGGEPLIWKDIKLLIQKMKNSGFLVKLDTNGTNPVLLTELINEKLIDFVAMDIKSPFEKYEKVTNSKSDVSKIKKSVEILMNSDIGNEFRTTVHSDFTTRDDLLKIAKELKGAKAYVLQEFRFKTSLLDNSCVGKNIYGREQLEKIKSEIEKTGFIKEVKIR